MTDVIGLETDGAADDAQDDDTLDDDPQTDNTDDKAPKQEPVQTVRFSDGHQ